MESSAGNFWRRQAKRTRMRHNFAAWLAVFLPCAVLASGITAVSIIGMRLSGEALAMFGVSVTALFVIAGGVAWVLSRRDFFDVDDAFVRLDLQLGLHNRLTSAARGIGEFPDPRSPISDGFVFRLRPVAVSLGLVALFPGMAAWIPLGMQTAPIAPTTVPSTWSEMESWLAELEESEIIEPEAIRNLEEKLAELREAEPEDWFSHSSLEAGDSLREQMAESLRSLERDLSSAATTMDDLRDASRDAGAGALERMQDRFDSAVNGLEAGNLPLNREMLGELRTIDAAKLRQLDPSEMAALRQRLEDGINACAACDGAGIASGCANGQPGEGTAGGGPGRDGETAPFAMKPTPTDLGTNSLEALNSADLSRALPGEVLGVGQTEHDPDPGTSVAVDGGAVASSDVRGDAVWRNNLSPSERRTLQKFFQ